MVKVNSFLALAAALACSPCCEAQTAVGFLRGPMTARRLFSNDASRDPQILEFAQPTTLQRRVNIFEDSVDYELVLDVKYICKSELAGGFGTLERTLLTYHNIINPPCQATFTDLNLIDFEEPECCRAGSSCESYFQPPNAQDDSVTVSNESSTSTSEGVSYTEGSTTSESTTYGESYTTGGSSSTVSSVTVGGTTYTTTTVITPASYANSTTAGYAVLPVVGYGTLSPKGPNQRRELQRQQIFSRVTYNTRALCSVILGCPPTSAPAERSINRRLNENNWDDMAPSIAPASHSPMDTFPEGEDTSLENLDRVGASRSSKDVGGFNYRAEPASCANHACHDADTSVTPDCETTLAVSPAKAPNEVRAPSNNPGVPLSPSTSPGKELDSGITPDAETTPGTGNSTTTVVGNITITFINDRVPSSTTEGATPPVSPVPSPAPLDDTPLLSPDQNTPGVAPSEVASPTPSSLSPVQNTPTAVPIGVTTSTPPVDIDPSTPEVPTPPFGVDLPTTDPGVITTDRPILVALLNGAGFIYVRDADYVTDRIIDCDQADVCSDETQGTCCGLDDCVCKSNPIYNN